MEDELISRAKAHDENAIMLLLNKYKGLLYKVTNQNHLRSIREEAYSEACLGFYEAILAYDKSLGVPFAGFAKSKVYAKVHSLFRKYLRIWQNEIFAYSKENDEEQEYINLFESNINMEENIIYKLDLSKILAKLSFKQRLVFNEIVLHGYNKNSNGKKAGNICTGSEQNV